MCGITLDEFKALSILPCNYCGLKPYNLRPLYETKRNKSVKVFESAFNGVDRVDSNKGYNLDNCVPCCTMCNKMKTNHTEGDFLRKIVEIYNHLSLGG